MGSDLYISIDVRHTRGLDPNPWGTLFDGPSKALDRGIVVDAFGDCDAGSPVGPSASGHLSHTEWAEMSEHEECPWRLDEPYWVRKINGEEFVAIIKEKRWQKLQDGDFHDRECSPELRGFAALVASLLADGLDVRVWCWHSQ